MVLSAEERLPASAASLAAWEQRLRHKQANLEARERLLQEREAMGRARQDEQATREASLTQDDISRMERQATLEAIKLLEAAEKAGGVESLGEARRYLEGRPCPQLAAKALMAIAGDASNKRTGAEPAVRDVVVLRCSSPASLGDRSAFLEAAEKAFDRPLDLDLELRAVLLLLLTSLVEAVFPCSLSPPAWEST